MAAAASAQADVVYTSGDAAIAAEVAKRLAGTGLDARIVGGAELRSERFVRAAGTAADGAVAVIAPLSRPDDGGRGGDIAARLDQLEFDGPTPLVAASYDAGAAIAAALSSCLPPEDTAADARKQCAVEMAHVSVAGATGEVAFDAFGDRAGMRAQVFEVRGGSWVEVGSA
jgi:ABC-type branched-subunit amino acid transport system substrate-binding protein